jgi:hypothetical protein
MDVKYDYCEDSRKIALFRVKVFCWWKKFTGHPAEMINEYCERKLNEIKCIRYFSCREAPYYSEIQKDYENFVVAQEKN